jgi:hypothetical protein
MLHLLLATALAPNLAPIDDPKKEAPRGLPPIVASARYEKGEFILTQTFQVTTYRAVEVTIETGGKPERRTEYVPELKVEVRRSTWKYRDLQGYGRDGGEMLDEKTLCKRLAKERAVLLSVDGKLIDPFYLKMLTEDGVALVLPPKKAEPKPDPNGKGEPRTEPKPESNPRPSGEPKPKPDNKPRS